jgi:ABC-type branched-subunit amino acid transport system ATPase component
MSDEVNGEAPVPILQARGMHAWYGSSHVLHSVDLDIGHTETVGLLARNGMGKSTLIRTLLGLWRGARAASRCSATTSRVPGRTRWRGKA